MCSSLAARTWSHRAGRWAVHGRARGAFVRVSVCAYRQIQLICQCSGLFLERPELASLNQAAINLPQQRQGAAGADAVERRLMGNRAVMLLEQVTVRSDGPFPGLHFSGERSEIMQWGDVHLSGYVFDGTSGFVTRRWRSSCTVPTVVSGGALRGSVRDTAASRL